jgi:hypothetical protein
MWLQTGPATCFGWNSRPRTESSTQLDCLNNNVEKSTASLCELFCA